MDDTTSSPQDPTVVNREPPTRKRQKPPQETVEPLERPAKQRNHCDEPKDSPSATRDGSTACIDWSDKSPIVPISTEVFSLCNYSIRSSSVDREESKPWLEQEGLKELNHRESESISLHTRGAARESKQTPQLIPAANYLARASKADITRIQSFARGGGPDLTDLRGSQNLPSIMASRKSGSERQRSTTTKTGRSLTPYHIEFEHHMNEHGIYSDHTAKFPENREEINARLARPRPSLSPSHFTDTVFQSFREEHFKALDEDDIMRNAIPTIRGLTPRTDVLATNTAFQNLKALTDGTIASAKPGLYYGALPKQLDRQIRERLMEYVIPSSQGKKPLAPNFFLEAKGPWGTSCVAIQQACYHGAIGARGIQVLQSYGLNGEIDELFYDNKSYTITSTHINGTLSFCAVYPTLSSENSPEYHMTMLQAWVLTNSPDDFRQGVAAFRNARDLAKEYRDDFIATANVRSVPKP